MLVAKKSITSTILITYLLFLLIFRFFFIAIFNVYNIIIIMSIIIIMAMTFMVFSKTFFFFQKLKERGNLGRSLVAEHLCAHISQNNTNSEHCTFRQHWVAQQFLYKVFVNKITFV